MDIGFNKKLRFKPESIIRIQSVLLLYIERIFVGFFAGITDYVKKKPAKNADREQKDG